MRVRKIATGVALTAVAVVALLMLAAVGLYGVDPPDVPWGDESSASPEPTPASAPSSDTSSGTGGPVEVSVMTQNMLYGGDDYDLRKGGFCAQADGCPEALHRLAGAIEKAGADVVGLQEPERNTARLARMLGWHASPRAHVVSRFPIIDPPGSEGRYVLVEPAPGRVLAVASTHLPSTPYGPYLVRDGATRAKVLRVERQLRVRWAAPLVAQLSELADRGVPVVVVGDFNSPSQLDWTQAVAKARRDVPYVVRWPAPLAFERAGFADSYRDVHPDPVREPGYTWTPGGPEGEPDEVLDRIDLVLHAGPVTTLDSRLVGEQGAQDVEVAVPAPYPSDHRGVVSTFEVTPAPVPQMVATSVRSLTPGDPLRVTTYDAPEDASLTLARADGGATTVEEPVDEGTTTTDVATAALEPGRYDATLVDDAGDELSTTPLYVYGADAGATVSADRASYAVGDPVTASWTNAPGMGADWVGVYRCRTRQKCAGVGSYQLYVYTHTAVEGSRSIDAVTTKEDEAGEGWPLPPGRYQLRLFVDDSYTRLAESAQFTIREGP